MHVLLVESHVLRVTGTAGGSGRAGSRQGRRGGRSRDHSHGGERTVASTVAPHQRPRRRLLSELAHVHSGWRLAAMSTSY